MSCRQSGRALLQATSAAAGACTHLQLPTAALRRLCLCVPFTPHRRPLRCKFFRSVEWEAGNNRSLTVDAAAAVLAGSWGKELVPVGVAVRWVLSVR